MLASVTTSHTCIFNLLKKCFLFLLFILTLFIQPQSQINLVNVSLFHFISDFHFHGRASFLRGRTPPPPPQCPQLLQCHHCRYPSAYFQCLLFTTFILFIFIFVCCETFNSVNKLVFVACLFSNSILSTSVVLRSDPNS